MRTATLVLAQKAVHRSRQLISGSRERTQSARRTLDAAKRRKAPKAA